MIRRTTSQELGHPFFCGFFLAPSMSPPLEIWNELNHGFAAQQIRQGRTRRGVSPLQLVRPTGIPVRIRQADTPGLFPPQGMAGREVAACRRPAFQSRQFRRSARQAVAQGRCKRSCRLRIITAAIGLTPCAPGSQSSADLVLSSGRINRSRHHLVFSMPVITLLL
jgi:hypothetical protein